jgi:tRNA threonylcarbamoyladenosine modification (KEOPS) complex  Pcc1 subunit
MKAVIEIECKSPELVAKALKPEIGEEKRFRASIEANKSGIALAIESQDISGLLAGINSYVTLARTSINAMEE